jgi:hypothetical protein
MMRKETPTMSTTPDPPFSAEWTPQERIRIVLAILPGMQADIYAGRYSAIGRPNITSLQHILSDPAESLEEIRDDLEKLVADFEAKYRT